MTLNIALEDYRDRYAKEQNLSVKSCKNRRLFCDSVAAFFTDKEFNLLHCRAFLELLRLTNSPASMQTKVKDLRAFIRFCFEYEYIEKDFSNKIPLPPAVKRLYILISETQAKEAIMAA